MDKSIIKLRELFSQIRGEKRMSKKAVIFVIAFILPLIIFGTRFIFWSNDEIRMDLWFLISLFLGFAYFFVFSIATNELKKFQFVDLVPANMVFLGTLFVGVTFNGSINRVYYFYLFILSLLLLGLLVYVTMLVANILRYDIPLGNIAESVMIILKTVTVALGTYSLVTMALYYKSIFYVILTFLLIFWSVLFIFNYYKEERSFEKSLLVAIMLSILSAIFIVMIEQNYLAASFVATIYYITINSYILTVKNISKSDFNVELGFILAIMLGVIILI
mgnify:CR=1 FL=1